jgi:hypothetical protein
LQPVTHGLKSIEAPKRFGRGCKPRPASGVSASEYEELQFLKEQWLKSELQKGFDDLQAGAY